MRRLTLLLVPIVALVAAGAAGAEGPVLRGAVGPGFTISLADASGARVTRLAPGPYELVVDDRSPEHNFHLTGPGVDEATGVEEVGTRTFQLTLVEGAYRFVCDPHNLSMRGSFTVGTGPAPPPSPPAPAPPAAPAPPRVVVTAGPAAIALRVGGKAVRRLKPGRYVVVARDRSRAHNVRLLGAGVRRSTTLRFTGVRRWTVTLRRGTLVFRSDGAPARLRGSIRVA